MRSLALAAVLLASSLAFAAGAKSYQVTGAVIELRDTVIVVEKAKEKFEINKGEAKVEGELKVGAKVTIEYTMTAKTVEVKAADAKKK